MTSGMHSPTSVAVCELPGHENDSLQFADDEGNHLSVFMLPHLARAMADAYAAARMSDAAVDAMPAQEAAE